MTPMTVRELIRALRTYRANGGSLNDSVMLVVGYRPDSSEGRALPVALHGLHPPVLDTPSDGFEELCLYSNNP